MQHRLLHFVTTLIAIQSLCPAFFFHPPGNSSDSDRFDVLEPPPPATRKKPKEVVHLVLVGHRFAKNHRQINHKNRLLSPPPPPSLNHPSLSVCSMGGLVCRAALPFLWDRDNTRPLRPNVIFESFITISKSHLQGQNRFLTLLQRYPSPWLPPTEGQRRWIGAVACSDACCSG
jgi:hypothetical protein